MKSKEKFNNNFEKLERNIEVLELDKKITEDLKKINFMLYNYGKNKLKDQLVIIVENINKENINLILDYITEMIFKYGLSSNEAEIFDSNNKKFDKDFIIVNDFELFKTEVLDSYHWCERFKEELKKNRLLILTCEDYLKNYYEEDFNELTFKNKIELKISGETKEKEDILKELKNIYEKNHIKYKITDKELLKIINETLKNEETYPSNCANYLYNYSYKQSIIKDKKIIDASCFKTETEKEEKTLKLEDLTGLENVKKEIETLTNFLSFRKKLKSDLNEIHLNMLFLGNPGTGKTTIAKIYTEILHKLGYIKENKVVEIIPTDLMANYVGQTKDKTRKILKEATGGVLFIDEAYLITNNSYSSGDNPFMKEAVVEIIKYMENPKNVVIFAGYPHETLKIYEANPGIESRICKELYFNDYTEEELLTILKNNLTKLGLKIDKEAQKKIKNVIKNAKIKKNFGNARFINTYSQKLLMNHANRNLKEEIFIITKEDVIEEEKNNISRLGFKGVH